MVVLTGGDNQAKNLKLWPYSYGADKKPKYKPPLSGAGNWGPPGEQALSARIERGKKTGEKQETFVEQKPEFGGQARERETFDRPTCPKSGCQQKSSNHGRAKPLIHERENREKERTKR